MKIEWLLDRSEPLDYANLLGDIWICCDEGKIHEPDTYIDSWFEALVCGLEKLTYSSFVTQDIVEEPNKLIFRKNNDRVSLQYKTSVVFVNSTDELKNTLALSIFRFLNCIGRFNKDNKDFPVIDFLQRFCNKEMIRDGSA